MNKLFLPVIITGLLFIYSCNIRQEYRDPYEKDEMYTPIDTSFGTNGKVITAIGESDEIIHDMEVASDGSIIAVGEIKRSDPYSDQTDFIIVKYDQYGNLDTTFGGHNNDDIKGTVSVDISSGNDDSAKSVVITSTNDIIVAGTSFNGSENQISIVKLKSDGSLDTTFDSDGQLIVTMLNGASEANKVMIDSNSKIIISGYNYNTKSNIVLLKYDMNGTPDPNFDSESEVTDSFTNFDFHAISSTKDANGKIIIVGYTPSASGTDFAITKYDINTAMTLDSTFGTNGIKTVDFDVNGSTTSYDKAYDVAIDNKKNPPVEISFTNFYNNIGDIPGTILVNGRYSSRLSENLTENEETIFNSCYTLSDDKTKYIKNTTIPSGTLASIRDILFKKNVFDYKLLYYGLLTDTAIPVNSYQKSIQDNFHNIIKYIYIKDNTNEKFTLNSESIYDDGSTGAITFQYHIIPIIENINKDFLEYGIVVVGETTTNGQEYNFAISKFNSNGVDFPPFTREYKNKDGDLLYTLNVNITEDFGFNKCYARSVQIDSADRIIIGGYREYDTNKKDFTLIKLLPDGKAYKFFGLKGKAAYNFGVSGDQGNCVELRSDNKVIMGGSASNGINLDFGIVQFSGSEELRLESKD